MTTFSTANITELCYGLCHQIILAQFNLILANINEDYIHKVLERHTYYEVILQPMANNPITPVLPKGSLIGRPDEL